MTGQRPSASFEALLEYLHRVRGFDFTGYKRSSLTRRVERRMDVVGAESVAAYQDYLEVHPDEFTLLFNTILINVTSFFRDEPAWQFLREQIIPQIVAGKDADAPIRVWSAGCASGEEAYSLTMLLAEALGTAGVLQRVKIYASDVDEEALAQARRATYSDKALEGVPEEWRKKYFVPSNGSFAFRGDLRRVVIFGRHDLVQDAPISRLDLLSCRNTLMYFNAEVQARILGRFHFALNERGFLFLGRAELLLTHANLFTPVEARHRVFTRTSRVSLRDRLLVLTPTGDVDGVAGISRIGRLRDAAFECGLAPEVLVDVDGMLVLANGEARRQFSLDLKDLGRPFQDLEVSYRPTDLRSLIDRAVAERRTVTVSHVERSLTGGGSQYFDIHVTPLANGANGVYGVRIAFNDVTVAERLQTELHRANQELETANEELQSASEELETTNEELQSTNEELETANEELQSTNEELETMNEELQSSNEELQTMNDELRLRSMEVQTSNAFLASTLGSLGVGVAVLDPALMVRVWNRQAEEFWGLRADEVLGESFLALDIGLPLHLVPVRAATSGEATTLEVDATTRRGKPMRCQVTVAPVVNRDGGREGVVVVMEDVTRRQELLLAEAGRAMAEGIVATVREPLVVLDGDLRIVSANPAFYGLFRARPIETEGELLYQIGEGRWDNAELRRLLEEVLPHDREMRDFAMVLDVPGAGARTLRLNARQVFSGAQRPQFILLAIEDGSPA